MTTKKPKTAKAAPKTAQTAQTTSPAAQASGSRQWPLAAASTTAILNWTAQNITAAVVSLNINNAVVGEYTLTENNNSHTFQNQWTLAGNTLTFTVTVTLSLNFDHTVSLNYTGSFVVDPFNWGPTVTDFNGPLAHWDGTSGF